MSTIDHFEGVPLLHRTMFPLVDDHGFIARKDLEDGRYITLTPQLYGTLLTLSQAGNEYGYSEAYTYDNPEKAVASYEAWEGNGEPNGWIRHIPSNRRRPNGDAAQEHVSP